MYLNGYSSPQIAEILTRSGVPTATNQTVWSSGGVLGILRNEKYCGNVLCQKTMTVDVFSHKAIKNTGQKTQYFIEGHHEPIILKSDWDRVQQMIDEKYYRKRRGRRTKPRIVLKGCLTGFTQIDLDWDEDDIARIFYSTTPAAEVATPAMADHIEIIKVKGEN